MSKNPERFGKGAEEGIIASETANNATIGGALIPLISMGIPGSVINVFLLAALCVHGIQPGPMLFTTNPEIVYTIIATMFVANIFMFLIMTGTVKYIAKVSMVPKAYILPVILVFCIIGSYAQANRMFDVWVLLIFGVVGFVMRKASIPHAPFVIGLVLTPIAEQNFRTGLMISGGSLLPHFHMAPQEKITSELNNNCSSSNESAGRKTMPLRSLACQNKLLIGAWIVPSPCFDCHYGPFRC